MGRPRTGSVYYHGAQKRWYGAISIGGGKRRWVTGATEDEARQKLAEIGADPPRRTAHVDYRALAAEVALSVLDRAAAQSWDRETTARVMAASMAIKRVRRQVVGPCHYCGDEFADQIDHVIPYAEGGQDTPGNVVSACLTCNTRKGRRRADVLSF